ncbi:MAG: hypothetical protein E6I48_07835 [Chloroflexi bacterium]|nr:MAG: hypothetical protein E6I48_07835 [Chloroflexota bacterium]
MPAVIEQLGTRARMTLTGLELAEDLTLEEFEQLFRTFVRLRDAERWALGDAINGFARHRGVRDEGLYRRVAKLTGLKEQQLRILSYVARWVNVVVRDNRLAWGLHRVVAKLKDPEEQRRWLAEAVRLSLTRENLRERIEQHDTDRALAEVRARVALEPPAAEARDEVIELPTPAQQLDADLAALQDAALMHRAVDEEGLQLSKTAGEELYRCVRADQREALRRIRAGEKPAAVIGPLAEARIAKLREEKAARDAEEAEYGAFLDQFTSDIGRYVWDIRHLLRFEADHGGDVSDETVGDLVLAVQVLTDWLPPEQRAAFAEKLGALADRLGEAPKGE